LDLHILARLYQITLPEAEEEADITLGQLPGVMADQAAVELEQNPTAMTEQQEQEIQAVVEVDVAIVEQAARAAPAWC
jgi:hypothetical protein